MILFDMNNVVVSLIMAESKGNPSFNEPLVRHMILNFIRTTKNKYKDKYGDVVLCYDSDKNWRLNIFKHYKANRKKQRSTSNFNWNDLFNLMDTMRVELKNNFPYKVLKVDNCEGDDIIAVLCKNYQSENNIIISADTDFQQLQKYKNVTQYSPILKKQLVCHDPEEYLFEHVLRGDASDGIPNILTDDDVFVSVEKKRQKTLSGKKYTEYLRIWNENGGPFNRDIFTISSDMNLVNKLQRNVTLIDFDEIPKDISDKILNTYCTIEVSDKSKILRYLIDNNMKNLTEYATEF